MAQTLDALIIAARKHLGNGAVMESSARLCLTDALRSQERGDWTAARMWAVKSLAYSVGICHADYQRAIAQPLVTR